MVKGYVDAFEDLTVTVHMIHNVLRNSMVQVLKSAPKVTSEKDVKDFMGFTQSFLDFLDHHHHHEDDIAFPVINTKLDTSDFSEDHKKVEDSLENLQRIVASFKADPSSYDPELLMSHMKALQAHLLPHLQAEEDTITRERLAAHFTEEEIYNMHKRIEKHAMQFDPTLDLALIWFSLSPKERQLHFFDSGKFPLIVSRILLPYAFLRKHKKTYWRFAMYA